MLHQGGSFVYSPEGAWGHCLGKKIIVDFQLQGDSFVYSPEGHGLGKLKFSMSNLKVAHLITHLSRGGIGSRFGYSNFHFELGHFGFSFKVPCVTTRGIICWYTIGCSYPLFGAFVGSFVIGLIVIGLVVVGYGSIVVVSVVFGPLSLNPLSIDVGSVVFESVVVGFVVTGS